MNDRGFGLYQAFKANKSYFYCPQTKLRGALADLRVVAQSFSGKIVCWRPTPGSWSPTWGKSWIRHWEGNVFTPLCHSVHGGSVSCQHTPLVISPGGLPPGEGGLHHSRHPPSPRYGQPAGGKHPTGMHTCS